MITIIKHGQTQMHELTCPQCGCIFRFTNDDLRIFRGTTILEIIDCPDCGEPLLMEE